MLKYNIFNRKNSFIKNKNYFCLNILKKDKKFIIFDKVKKASFYPKENVNKKNIISCIYNIIGEEIFYIKRCGIISRLDLETKGIFLFLRKNLKFIIIKKRYLVISKCTKLYKKIFLKGYIKKIKNKVFFSKKPTNCPVYTKFYVKNIKKEKILILCEFIKGKTHQIRSSLKYLSINILGDNKYGIYNKKYHENNLHSWNIVFKIKNKVYSFYSLPNTIFIKYYKNINFSKFNI